MLIKTGISISLDQKIGLVKFPNRYALESIGNNFYNKNSATGEPVNDADQGQKVLLLKASWNLQMFRLCKKW